MREIWAADCETDPFSYGRVPLPFIWGATNGKDYYQFDDTEQFVKFFKNKKCIVYAHNGGKFDWLYLTDYIADFSPVMLISGRMAKFTIGECEFRDSYNILPTPLSAYKKDEFDYSLLEKEKRDIPGNRAKIEQYLQDDCVYLHEYIIAFISEYGCNLTLAGSAMKFWEKHFLQKKQKANTSQSFYNEFSKFYYGGRVQAFKSGLINYPVTVADINSAYPYAMTFNHPYGDDFRALKHLPVDPGTLERSFIVLVGTAKGSLPFRTKKGLSFPDDDVQRTYQVTGWELIQAMEHNAIDIQRIVKCYTFGETICFDDYVQHFIEQKNSAKQSNDVAGYIFAKLFLNSLYGKYGANPEKYEEFEIIPPEYIRASADDDWRFVSNVKQRALVAKPLDESKWRFFNTATAASITGFVRAMLFKSIKQCKDVVYCDTDSIIARDVSALELDPFKLGAWDVEAECTHGGVGGKKLYAFYKNDGGTKIASKGARLTAEQIMYICDGNEFTYKPEVPTMSLRSGIKFIDRKICMTN